ncbi:DUF1963 domain-containing protein [Streptomyces sp. I05A-00742]|uniref:DUF1963 domain-containing protein n=1 Tax=Streptomyces sp. I05A-00742 TaxID=2732853 RepID=UPI001489C6B5|nr:DUF1963 domain-containing protein [Streptomyces sp. I05A-00742]
MTSQSAADELRAVARAHLPAAAAERWISLLRPCARLVRAEAGDEASAGADAIPRVPLSVRLEASVPDPWHPVAEEAFAPDLGEGGWTLLAQFAMSDGCLYWLIRPRDLAERRFDRAMFTWQRYD